MGIKKLCQVGLLLILAGHAFANVAITPTWDSIYANTADSAGIEWDVWWGSPDITQACYQFDGQDLGCVTTTSVSTAAVNANTDGSYLAVTSGEDSKGYMPVVFPAAGVGTYPAQIELHDASGVVSTHAFDMTFLASRPSAGRIFSNPLHRSGRSAN